MAVETREGLGPVFAPLRPLGFVFAALFLYAGLVGQPAVSDGQRPVRMTCSDAQDPANASKWAVLDPSSLDLQDRIDVPDHGTFVPIRTAGPCPVLGWYPDGATVPPKDAVRFAIGYLVRLTPQTDSSQLAVVDLYYPGQYRSGATVLEIGRRTPYLWQVPAFVFGVLLGLLFMPWGRMRLRRRDPEPWSRR